MQDVLDRDLIKEVKVKGRHLFLIIYPLKCLDFDKHNSKGCWATKTKKKIRSISEQAHVVPFKKPLDLLQKLLQHQQTSQCKYYISF